MKETKKKRAKARPCPINLGWGKRKEKRGRGPLNPTCRKKKKKKKWHPSGKKTCPLSFIFIKMQSRGKKSPTSPKESPPFSEEKIKGKGIT